MYLSKLWKVLKSPYARLLVGILENCLVRKNNRKMSQLTNNLSAKDSYSRTCVPWKTFWKQLTISGPSIASDTQNYLQGLQATNPNFILVSWQYDIQHRVILFQFIDQTDFLP